MNNSKEVVPKPVAVTVILCRQCPGWDKLSKMQSVSAWEPGGEETRPQSGDCVRHCAIAMVRHHDGDNV